MNPKITISLPIDFYTKLGILASKKGISPQLLSRIFIIEKINGLSGDQIPHQILEEWCQK